MSRTLSAEIIASGTELLLGETVDTNSAYIARQLRDLGIDVYYHTTVGDNVRRTRAAVEAAVARANLVIVTGGLGPTVDDVTREAIAGAVGQHLVFSPELLDQIAERFSRFGRTMSDNNRRQAFIPEGAVAIPNPVGTAPAFRVEQGEAIVIALPGVPREMHYLMEHAVIPYLRSLVGAAMIHARVLHTAGLGESQVDTLIGDLMEAGNPTVGLSAHPGRTDVRITAKAGSLEAAEGLIAPVEATIRERLAGHVYGADGERLGPAVVEALRAGGHRLAVGETLTEGLIAQELLETGGDLVVTGEVRLPTGPTDEADALAVANDLLIETEADYALVSLAGAAPSSDDEAGRREAIVAIVGPDHQWADSFSFGSHAGLFQGWVVNQSLYLLWRRLTNIGDAGIPA